MSRTGHRSVDGVRAYKKTSMKLKTPSSSILNSCEADSEEIGLTTTTRKAEVSRPSGLENSPLCHQESKLPQSIPPINFDNASHFTVN